MQRSDFGRQLGNWNIKENNNEDIQGPPFTHIIGSVFDVTSAYRFEINGVTMKFHPSTAFMTETRWALVSEEMKDTMANTTLPDFVVEVRPYGPGQTNQLDYLHRKMCQWMGTTDIQTQSGILFDRLGNNVYLYCRNDLPNIQAQVDAQQANLDRLPWQDYQHVYFQNLTPVGQIVYKGVQENYPNVSYIQIPLNLEPTAKHGPNMIIHCIGAVNGLSLDLSTIPLD
ncbi:hypothetical protein SAMD00019534_104840 [Acytostelium subglobosum LB1]|uniref:hypothetical protein n=1 Tax=Acytostelium subglobosum LB1 TaxID=1410327 RepID=UPI000644E0A6|nr:hypothetical protein SAMD00019534_104840 [Acytostelium subglobosum LB1]GAM27309.1 hypothetical protein SAMD00019534_104840 [Acytostelium subglobosum LB1]|eukprot:XP_012749776.1 hypothetical protein SAMD00019534_104840 [Acytostelium subglobosum LB1]